MKGFILSMQALAITLAASTAFAAGPQPGNAAPVAQCQRLMNEPGFDCACVIGFLERHLHGQDLDIVLSTWAFSVDRRSDHAGDVTSLYMKYGTLQIDEVLRRFSRVRFDLFMKCPNVEPIEEDDPL